MKKKKEFFRWIEENQNMIVLSIIFLFMFLLNTFTPYIADDINYRNIWGTTNKVQNLWDILVSQYNHYFSWGGRSVAHTIAQFFLMFPKFLFNIANSICYVGILAKINSIATNKKKNAWILLFIHLILFFIVPYFGEDFLWLIGSCNYAWTMWLVLIFFDIYHKNEKKDSTKTIVGMFFLGLLAGWSNENTGFALVMMTSFYLLYQKFVEKKKIMNWQRTGLIGSAIGYGILLIAPGNYVRSAGLTQEGSFLSRTLKTTIDLTGDAIELLWPLLLGILILFTYYCYQKKKPNIMSYLFLIGSFISLYAMVVSPQFPPRAWVGIVIYLTIAVISLFDAVSEKEKIIRYAFYDALIVMSVCFLKDYYRITEELRLYNYVIETREEYIKDHPNQEIYYFEKHMIDDKYSPIHGEDLTEDKDNWVNEAQAKRYQVPYIIGY